MCPAPGGVAAVTAAVAATWVEDAAADGATVTAVVPTDELAKPGGGGHEGAQRGHGGGGHERGRTLKRKAICWLAVSRRLRSKIPRTRPRIDVDKQMYVYIRRGHNKTLSKTMDCV